MLFRQLPLAFCLLLFALPSYSQSVIRDGKEWLQPVDFRSITWNQVNAVCPASAGWLCNGDLNGTDVTGYTWASVDDVNALFNSYGIAPPLGPGGDVLTAPYIEPVRLFFIDFEEMFTDGNEFRLDGWTREVSGDGLQGGVGWLRYFQVENDPREDLVCTGCGEAVDLSQDVFGVFLFRGTEPTQVPTLPLYGLWITVLGLAAIAARRLSRQSRVG